MVEFKTIRITNTGWANDDLYDIYKSSRYLYSDQLHGTHQPDFETGVVVKYSVFILGEEPTIVANISYERCNT